MSNQQQDYSSSTGTGGRVNPNLPDSYNPVMDQRNFNAPAHNLDTQQQEQVAELAEASSGHIHAGNNIAGGHFGSANTPTGSSNSNNNTSSLADTLSSTGGQQRGNLGKYEYSENQLDEPRDNVRGSSGTGHSSGLGRSDHSSGLSGTGHGTHQAAGAGVGGGLAATAAQQGLGSTGRGNERSIEDQRLGGLVGDSSYNDSNSRSGAGLGAGAGAAGLAGASAVGTGAGAGHTGQGNTMREAMSDSQGHSSRSSGGLGSSGAMGAGAAGAAGAAGLSAGQRDPSGHGAGAGEKGLLAQPQYETGLTSELERRAQKAGTHAAGFGTHGNE